MFHAATEMTARPCALTEIDSARLISLRKKERATKKIKVATLILAPVVEREGQFPLPSQFAVPRLVCSPFWQALGCAAPFRFGLLGQQTELPHQICLRLPFRKHVSGLASGRFSFALHVMLAACFWRNFHQAQTFHVSKPGICKGPFMGDSRGILQARDPVGMGLRMANTTVSPHTPISI